MRGIVILGHGTKDPDGVAEFLELVQGVRQRSGEFVAAGVLEYPSPRVPSIAQALELAEAEGLDDVVGLPALLHFGGHSREDIPGEIKRAQARHPHLRIALAGPLGYEERLLRTVEERLAPFPQDEDTALLLVGRGSLNSEANADLFKAARLLWDRNRLGWVEAAFVSVSPPGVPEGIERCARLGAKRVIVAPYFLNTGVLVKRIGQQAHHATAEVQMAPHLGLHPLVYDVLLERLRQARAGLCPCQAASGCRIPEWECPRGAACLTA